MDSAQRLGAVTVRPARPTDVPQLLGLFGELAEYGTSSTSYEEPRIFLAGRCSGIARQPRP